MFRLKNLTNSWCRMLYSLQNPSHNVLISSNHVMKKKCQQTYISTWKRDLLQQQGTATMNRRNYCSDEPQLTKAEYEDFADETLDSLTEMFEDIQERLDVDKEYDVSFNSGVLTVKISKSWGTYVINKQTPNKQIWFSSPKSGPKRYDYQDGRWIYKHDGSVLHELLTKEISEALGQETDFTTCSYGSR